MTKIGTGIDPREPFGLYTLAMAKEDSDRLLKPYKEHRKRVEQWREFGFTVVDLFIGVGIVGVFSLNGIMS